MISFLSFSLSLSLFLSRVVNLLPTPEGSWQDDMRSGDGKYVYANGDTFEGEWVNNVREGQGSYTYASTGSRVGQRLHEADEEEEGTPPSLTSAVSLPAVRGIVEQRQAHGPGRAGAQQPPLCGHLCGRPGLF